ncbi:MAG: rRNA pseudouridine synthase [Candidatus Doudnabacteria bacterium]|nr:rRNA pseudouridine synthase [Candidatus Doudnabacteria bacterium]
MQERLQKIISQAGIASRRHAEELILAGKVKVNGKVVKELGTKADAEKDKIEVDAKPIHKQKLIYLMMNKPKRYMTTRSDPRKRKTVYDLLPEDLRNVVWPIGRLDFLTEGLLLFTNDGELTQQLAHPSKEHEKEYEVVIDKELSSGRLEKMREGMILDGTKTAPAKVLVNGTTIRVTIHEGRNRQVRRMFSSFGYTIRSLKRVRVGKLVLKDLQLGQYKLIEKKDII